jgi:hypothetical protein
MRVAAVVLMLTALVAPASRIAVEHAILDATELHGVRGLQIDFGARAPEREFYRAVLLDLRRVLPASIDAICAPPGFPRGPR